MFQMLLRAAEGKISSCARCSGPAAIHLTFDFGLNASHNEAEIEGVFCPRRLESWQTKRGQKVTFYPFLVILKRAHRKRAVWLPYWHVVERRGKRPAQKYGQWAPFMDARLFESLLAQAREAGLVN